MRTGIRRVRRTGREIYYFDSERMEETVVCAGFLREMIAGTAQEKGQDGVVFLCIGTDRSTGDSLGPLTGYKLKEYPLRRAEVVGTLSDPVHAMNLETCMERIRARYPRHVIVAVDASVGSREHVGCVTLGRGALRPGLGVSKELQAVGDIFMTGIVGSYGNYDPLMLQSVRLSVVMRMADYICDSVCLALEGLCAEKEGLKGICHLSGIVGGRAR
ncbi:MAG: spore protease YyaC [Clostridiales bacterium]|nr:spore protease YyaC [Clostridiales bacterium]